VDCISQTLYRFELFEGLAKQCSDRRGAGSREGGISFAPPPPYQISVLDILITNIFRNI
jgi:hypothetical protein